MEATVTIRATVKELDLIRSAVNQALDAAETVVRDGYIEGFTVVPSQRSKARLEVQDYKSLLQVLG